LWHGAAWTFIFWGVWHGLWLSVNRCFSQWRGKVSKPSDLEGIGKCVLGWAGTMLIVIFGWLLFRSIDGHQALRMISGNLSFREGIQWFPPVVILCIGLVMLRHLFLILPGGEDAMDLRPERIRTSFALFVMVATVILFRPHTTRQNFESEVV